MKGLKCFVKEARTLAYIRLTHSCIYQLFMHIHVQNTQGTLQDRLGPTVLTNSNRHMGETSRVINALMN